MKHLSEMKINRNDIKRKTVHKFKYLQYWIFLNPRKLFRLNVNEMTVMTKMLLSIALNISACCLYLIQSLFPVDMFFREMFCK